MHPQQAPRRPFLPEPNAFSGLRMDEVVVVEVDEGTTVWLFSSTQKKFGMGSNINSWYNSF